MQWAKYKPAWDIAAPLLRHRSVVGDPGRATGLEVSVETWLLLETALTRALRALASGPGNFEAVPKGKYPLLKQGTETKLRVEPDGLLRKNGTVVASFECKYTLPGETPSEDHSHQALATAAAVSSPLSVLVYPGPQPARRYAVAGFQDMPRELVTVGLDLFAYRRGVGDVERANRIARILATREP